MEITRYSLAWDRYHLEMCAGFSSLQKNGELVDLTLAAEGQLVRVHQTVLGIASPYLKRLILSVDCKHPVIFMNNMSYNMLCSILDYIYTGEVSIDQENLDDFMATAKILQIKGLDGAMQSPDPLKEVKINYEVSIPSYQGFPAKNIGLTSRTPVKRRFSDDTTDAAIETHDNSDQDQEEDEHLFSESADESGKERTEKRRKGDSDSIIPKADLRYTVSNRGSLQLILNRYIYNLRNYDGGPVRRWKCVELCCRRRCQATVVTENDVVVKRIHVHNHPYHDKRILAKIEKRAVYTAIRTAEKGLEIKPSDQSSET